MIRLKEVVPIAKVPEIERGLSAKRKEVGPDTFGVDMEFHTNDPRGGYLDPWDFLDEFEAQYGNRAAQNAFEEWLIDSRESANRRWNGNVHYWDDAFGPVDVEKWDSYHPEPEREDYDTEEEYDDVHNRWESDREDVERTYNRWDQDELISDWIKSTIEDNTWDTYFTIPDQEPEYNDYMEVDVGEKIEELYGGGKRYDQLGWEIGVDSNDIMEIRTPPMEYTPENLHILQEVMFFAYKNLYAAGDTSAHVHVGVPADSTIFDLLAATTLVDEKAVKKDLSADRELEKFSQLAQDVHHRIVSAISQMLYADGEKKLIDFVGKSFTADNKTLETFVRRIVHRNSGTNLQAFFKHKTMEFRYFSSQIAPNFGKFEQWIKYFMLIPKVARSRNQFVVGKDTPTPLAFTRGEKGKTKITILDKHGKLPKSTGRPSDYLRTSVSDPDKEERKVLSLLKRRLAAQQELPLSRLP